MAVLLAGDASLLQSPMANNVTIIWSSSSAAAAWEREEKQRMRELVMGPIVL